MKKQILKSSCDDSHFMSGEIILELNKADNLGGIRMNLELQAYLPAYLRKEEIKDLIDNLQNFYNQL
jgi:hypothetical protein